ncbi:MAG: nicotinate-nucleotide adenylyltransferase [Planctomycetota bacterium]
MIAPPPPLSSCAFATLACMVDAHPAPDEVLRHAEPPLVLCPLGFERRAFRRFGKLPCVTTGPGADAIRRAFAARDRWPVAQPSMVILLGVAGGLDPALPSGAAVLIGRALADDGAPPIDSGLPFLPASAVATTCIVRTPEAKAALRAATGASVVDLESYAFASCAHSAGLPRAIVRGVSDGARDTLPEGLDGLIDARGETRLSRVIASILRRPTLLSELVRLAPVARAAMRDAAFAADALALHDAVARCSRERPLLLFGGSFDPPHARHATVLGEAMLALRSPCGLVMPAAINPLKSATPPADPTARLAMCRATFAAIPAGLGEVRLSRRELDRAGPSYTIDTIEALCAARPALRGAIRMLVGSDAIRSIERWHRWRELLALATPAVVVRPPDTRAETEAFLEDLGARAGIPDAARWLLEVPAVDLSSTGIRDAIARGQRPEGLDDGAWAEIERRGLYRFGEAR